MSTPLVSVIMPTRNRADLMQRALDSVIAQSMTDWELLVVDDASTDGTRSVLERRASVDPRIRPLPMPEQRGAAVARNRALTIARGELVSFIDDDDEWLASKLELHAALFAEDAGVGLVHGPFVEVHADGFERVAGTYTAVGGRALDDLLSGNQLGHSTVTARTAAVKRVGGFDERLPRLQDWDLWIRLAAITGFASVTSPLARVHITPGSISTQTDALRIACGVMAKKYPAAAGLGRAQHAELCYALGQLLIRHRDDIHGRRYVRQALRIYPWPPRRIAGGLLAQFGSRVYQAGASFHARMSTRLRQHRLPPC
jgi:glycosyltransferase involved in cell wall biosynthesis